MLRAKLWLIQGTWRADLEKLRSMLSDLFTYPVNEKLSERRNGGLSARFVELKVWGPKADMPLSKGWKV
jgi:hypothetical protein